MRVAALLLAGLQLSCGEFQSEEERQIRSLAAALRGRRLTEPRLTGPFPHAECSVSELATDLIPDRTCSALPRPGTQDYVALMEVIEEVRRTGVADSYPHRSVALAELLLHDDTSSRGLDRAVDELRRWVDGNPDLAKGHSDLAAAYFVRAQKRDDPLDLVRALSAAEQAVSIDAFHEPALFNRALVSERLFLQHRARAAWQAYAAADSTSAWANEARRHVRVLSEPGADSTAAVLEQRVLAGDASAITDFVADYPGTARRFALDVVLNSWAELVAAGDFDQAAQKLRRAAWIGDAFSAIGGDLTVKRAVEVINEAPPDSANETLSSLASGHRSYASAKAYYGRLDLDAAEAHFLHASSNFGTSRSPIVLWTELWQAGIALNKANYEEAVRRFRTVLLAADPASFPALMGRANWGIGVARGRQGRFGESLVHYAQALIAFREAHETEGIGTLHGLLAENLDLIGQPREAWNNRYQALREFRRRPASPVSRAALNHVGNLAQQLGQWHAALAFYDEGVLISLQALNPHSIVEALTERSRVRNHLGRVEEALNDLYQARLWVDSIPDTLIRQRILIDVVAADAESRRYTDPQASVDGFARVVDYFAQRNDTANMVTALVDQAKTLISAEQYQRAELSLSRAIEIVDHQRAAMAYDTLGSSFAATVQEVFDEMMLLQAIQLQRPGLALAYAEHARAMLNPGRLWLSLRAPTMASLLTDRAQADARQYPVIAPAEALEDAAFIEYAVAGDHVLVWIITAREILHVPLLGQAPVIQELAEEYIEAIRNRQDLQALNRISSALYEALLPPEARNLAPDLDFIIIPDKFLNVLPFAALRNPETGRFLIEERAIALAPSAAFYAALVARQPTSVRQGSALLVANPAFDRARLPWLNSLPGADQEVRRVADLYGRAHRLTAGGATKQAILSELDRHVVFHYAGHAVYNALRPRSSFLVLADSDNVPGSPDLYTAELDGLAFNTLRLVVLSACNTITSATARTAGLSGLGSPFLAAGAHAVLGTLWEADDDAARELVIAFHTTWLRGATAREALQRAQLLLLRSRTTAFRSPHAWATFQLVGRLN